MSDCNDIFSAHTLRLGTTTLLLLRLTMEVTEMCCLSSVIAVGQLMLLWGPPHQHDIVHYEGNYLRKTTASGDISPNKSWIFFLIYSQ